MNESRAELVAWVNELLGLNYTKVEQLGTGDMPMSKVKFTAKGEHEYLLNYKILQKCFIDKQVEKVIPVEKLMKCRMQDNLEFLQWNKWYWDRTFPGDVYDAVARRAGAAVESPSSNRSSHNSTPVRRPPVNSGGSAANRSVSGRGSSLGVGNASASYRSSPDPSVVLTLQKELHEERSTVAALEKERDFYFGKLRDIEVLIQNTLAVDPDIPEAPFMKQVQGVLYNTEEGFEVPDEEEGNIGGEAGVLADTEYPDETF
ncbi:hypothetical protein BGZ83_002407 [Gryganskiella cystojenkinii]|nr:hypothetical protein BGZ83_002407 [Gryganskiella cystojenkinii]